MSARSIVAALQYYAPHRTGYTLHVQRVAEALAARGHRVTAIAARSSAALAARETLNGVRVERLAAPLRVSRGMLMPAYPRAAWRLAGDADVVWANSPMAELALWGALARRRGARLVITHHGDLHLPAGGLNGAIERVTRAGWAFAARRADAIVAYSDDYADHSPWLAPWRAKVVVITPPIAIPAPRREAVAKLRRELAPEGGPLIGFAGRFAREKRPDLLLDAIAPLRRRYPALRVAFAGEERLRYEDTREALAPRVAAAGDAVRFVGLVEDPRALAAFYAACDVLALPSQTECFGLVQAEAMLCGTPVVASDIPGARVPVTLTGAGRLFASGSVDALVEALDEVLARRERYAPHPARVAAAFDLARTIDAYERVLGAVA